MEFAPAPTTPQVHTDGAGQDSAVEFLRGRSIAAESRVPLCLQETVDFVQKSEEHAAGSEDNENSRGIGEV